MADPIELHFGLIPTSSRSQRAEYAKCINFIKERNGEVISLHVRPGYEELLDMGDASENRAQIVAKDKMYVLLGATFYEISDGLVVTSRGTVGTSSGDAKMDFDGFIITIVDGEYFYKYNVQNQTFARVIDSGVPYGATELVFNDGFHYVVEPNTGRFHTHTLAFAPDGEWGDEATAEYDGDNLVSISKDSAYVYLIGLNTTEVWESNPDGSFPLRPNRNAYMEYGCAAKKTPVQFANGLHWLAREKHGGYVAIRVEGARTKRLSTHSLESEWAGYSKVSDAHSQVWNIEGHVLWILTFPTAKKTWVYDESLAVEDEQRWSEFQFYDENPLEKDVFTGVNSVFFDTADSGSITVVGDRSDTGKLYKVSFDILEDDGTEIQAVATSQEIKTADAEWVDHTEVELYIDTGLGSTAESTVPKVRLRYSDDHGRTWVNKEWSSMGWEGEHTLRVRFKGLGRSRWRIYEVQMASKVQKALIMGIVRREGVDLTEPTQVTSQG